MALILQVHVLLFLSLTFMALGQNKTIIDTIGGITSLPACAVRLAP